MQLVLKCTLALEKVLSEPRVDLDHASAFCREANDERDSANDIRSPGVEPQISSKSERHLTAADGRDGRTGRRRSCRHLRRYEHVLLLRDELHARLSP